MNEVYLLWHAHHAESDDGPIRHQASVDGDWYADEELGDDVKLLGVYSTRARAEARIARARLLPGFGDEPSCFCVSPYRVDRDEWASGYLSS